MYSIFFLYTLCPVSFLLVFKKQNKTGSASVKFPQGGKELQEVVASLADANEVCNDVAVAAVQCNFFFK